MIRFGRAPTPPSTAGALAGALLLCNLSASNIVVGKSADRHLLCRSQSSRCLAAYAYSAAGAGESTNDLAWDGQGMIYEMGDLLAQSARFARSEQLVQADVDLQRIRLERLRTPTFHDAAIGTEKGEPFRRVLFKHEPSYAERGLTRPIRRFPYVPDEASRLDEDCFEAFNIQVAGLIRRFEATPGNRLVIGLSGGLDSTHALIVAAKACDLLGLPRTTILGFTMPGFATGDATKSNAWRLKSGMRPIRPIGSFPIWRPCTQCCAARASPSRPARSAKFFSVAAKNGIMRSRRFRICKTSSARPATLSQREPEGVLRPPGIC